MWLMAKTQALGYFNKACQSRFLVMKSVLGNFIFIAESVCWFDLFAPRELQQINYLILWDRERSTERSRRSLTCPVYRTGETPILQEILGYFITWKSLSVPAFLVTGVRLQSSGTFVKNLLKCIF